MFSLHVPEPGSLVVPRAAAISELDCRDLFSDDDKASLIPLVLQRSGNTGQLVVSLKGVILSPELECDVLFQRENENLNLAVAHGMALFTMSSLITPGLWTKSASKTGRTHALLLWF